MDFSVAYRKVESGQFAIWSSDGRPRAQVFVAHKSPVPEQFSFFWSAWSKRPHIHDLLKSLPRAESELKVRLIGQSYVTTFGFCRTPPATPDPEGWNLDLIHQLIEKADLPYSLGLSIDTSRFGGWVSELYVWASIAGATEGGDLKGGPEAGIRTTLHDWHKPDFDGVVFPLFEHTIGLKEGARDLWSQAADAAKSLMPH